MKKLLQVLSATVVGTGMMVGVAAADQTCRIDTTGPSSVNVCTNTSNQTVTATCTNNIFVGSTNNQNASSGSGNVSGNTTGGSAVTGSAVNQNNQVVQIGAACDSATGNAVATVSAPAGGSGAGAAAAAPAGGKGAGAAAATSPAAAASVKALPHTGSNTLVNTTVAGITGIGAVLAVSQLGSLVYRRLALK